MLEGVMKVEPHGRISALVKRDTKSLFSLSSQTHCAERPCEDIEYYRELCSN